MGITFQQETLAEFLPDAEPLLAQHWQEVGSCPESHKLSLNYDAYARVEAIGGLFIMSARYGGALVGYAIYFVQEYQHVTGLCMAQSDALYLIPAYRQGFTGVRLLQESERALIAKGVKNIMQTCTCKRDFGPVLKRMGYALTEHVYRKEI